MLSARFVFCSVLTSVAAAVVPAQVKAQDAYTVITTIAGMVANEQQRQALNEKLEELLKNEEQLKSMLAGVRNIVREEIAEADLRRQRGEINRARERRADGEFQQAHDLLDGALNQLMVSDVEASVGVVAMFLIGVDLHLDVLDQMGSTDAKYKGVIRRRAADYAEHARGLIPKIETLAAQKRISIDHIHPPRHPRTNYKIDGIKHGWIEGIRGLDAFPNRVAYDKKRISAQLEIPLRICAEKYQAIAEGREHDYSRALDGYIISTNNRPGIYVFGPTEDLGAQRLAFARLEHALLFALQVDYVPPEVYQNVWEHTPGTTFYMAPRAQQAPQRPAAFFFHLDGEDNRFQMWPCDDIKVFQALGSEIKYVSIDEYGMLMGARIPIAAHLHSLRGRVEPLNSP